jgi:hypothetical protein
MLNFDPTQAQQTQVNRAGQITPEQRTRLESDTRLKWWGLLMPFVFLPLIFIGIVGVVWYTDRRQAAPLVVYLAIAGFFAIIELITIIPQLLGLYNNYRLRADVAAGQVEALEGQCVWRRNKYRLETPARSLKLPTWSRALLPGSYRFYFLPNTGFVLSAERLTPPGGEDPRAELLNVMTQVHHFKVEDLEANREGRLSGGQIAGLISKAVTYSIIWVVVLIFGIAIWVAVYEDAHSSSAEELIFVIGAGISLVLIAIFLWMVARVLIDAVRGQVTIAQGLVRRTFTVTHSQHGTSTTYYYKLDKLSFNVSSPAYTAFIEGPQYRLYYAPLSKSLIAIEPL